jgi:hypothetical protein
MRVWWLELRRSPALLGGPLLVLLHGAITVHQLSPGTSIYLNSSSAVVSGDLLSGPLAAGLAAWVATREGRRHTAYLRVTSARGELAQPALELSVVLAVATVSYLVVAAVVLGRTAAGATWGQPHWAWLAVGWMALTLFVVAGYVAGRLVPRAWTPPAMMLCAYLAGAWNLAQYRRPWYLLSGATVEVVSVFRRLNGELLAGQALWYAGVAGALLAVAAIMLGPRRRLGVTALAGCTALAVAGAAIVIGQHNRVQTSPVSFRYACAGTAPVVCVHPAYAKGLQPLTAAFADLDRKLAGTPAGATRIEQLDSDARLRPSAGAQRFALDNLAPGYVQAAIGDFLDSAGIGPTACIDLGEQGVRSGAVIYAYMVRAWLMDSGTSQPVAVWTTQQRAMWNWFVRLGEEGRRAWLRDRFPRVVACQITAADFRTAAP